jgi:ABC-type Mn2+/Zn2+ transport system permease subunit
LIRDFLESWDLLGASYAAGALAAALLGMSGVYLRAREQVFLGAVIAQAAACGVAVVGLFGEEGAHELHATAAVAFALATAAVLSRRAAGPPAQAAAFCALGAVAVLAASKSPRGMEEVEQLVTSSLLGAGEEHLALLAAFAATLLPAGVALRHRLLACALDADAAQAQGARPRLVLGALTTACAAATGVALHTAGLLFAFGMLVLPAALAARACRSALAALVVAPLSAVLASASGFVLSAGWDLPPGPLSVALLAAACALARRGR